jgi:hypothetical protein
MIERAIGSTGQTRGTPALRYRSIFAVISACRLPGDRTSIQDLVVVNVQFEEADIVDG